MNKSNSIQVKKKCDNVKIPKISIYEISNHFHQNLSLTRFEKKVYGFLQPIRNCEFINIFFLF